MPGHSTSDNSRPASLHSVPSHHSTHSHHSTVVGHHPDHSEPTSSLENHIGAKSYPRHDPNHTPPPTSNEKQPAPFSAQFLDKETASARKIYFKVFLSGCFLVILTIFAVFSIYWGSLWKTPARNLHGWIVDFDNALVGQTFVQGITSGSTPSKITWKVVPASMFPGGPQEVANSVVEQHTWVALIINPNATARLQESYTTPNALYNGSQAITVFAAEARNENAFRLIIRPSVQTQLGTLTQQFAINALGTLSPASVTALSRTSPQTLVAPVSYNIDVLVPFDHPVATAITFVGLIYQFILGFFVVMIGNSARDVSGMNKRLTLRSLITVRFISIFSAYFIVSLFYALLCLAFQMDFSRKFGNGGFVIFWMLNWAGMLSLGLALEAMITLLTMRFIPFFMILWVLMNVAVSFYPLEVLPIVFRYGYAVPFYNVSHAARCISFGTKNTLGLNFGVLIAWIAISCVTLPLIQWYIRKQDVRAYVQERAKLSGTTLAGA